MKAIIEDELARLALAAPFSVLVDALSDPFPRSQGMPLLGPTLVTAGPEDTLVFDCPHCQQRGLGVRPTAQSFGPRFERWSCIRCRRKGDRADLAELVLRRPAARARLRQLAQESRRGR